MLTAKEVSWVLISYCLGCFTAGYYLVRLRTGQDLRSQGSGAVGARNAGRLLGPAGFLATFLLDFGKGALAVAGARYLRLSNAAVVATILAVVMGHAFPVQLRFRGGKGVATSLGALFAYNPWIGGILAAIFLPAFALIRSFTLAGLLAFALAPLAVFFGGLGNAASSVVCLLAILVLLLHHRNIREEYARLFRGRAVKNTPVHKRRGM
jgi:glycerol-3-phosphate acyltransferase PlsY